MQRPFVQPVTIFVSSPSDVAAEREAALRAIARLGTMRHIRSRYALIPVAYEDAAAPVVGVAPQEVVDRYAMRAAEADVYVCILWRRMGTPFRDPETGAEYRSGTEYEFLDAYAARERNGTPAMLLYRCTRPPEEGAAAGQEEAVGDFFGRFTGPAADFHGLYADYATVEEFADRFLRDLDDLLAEDWAPRVPVTARASLHSSGCTLSFGLPEAATLIEYRLAGEPEYRGTGFVAGQVNPQTGGPVPYYHIELPRLRGRLELTVRYRDVFGEQKGPFDLTVDPAEQRLLELRQAVESSPWRLLAFGRSEGRSLAYFAHLLVFKDVIRRIDYSVDSERLDRTLRFEPAEPGELAGIGEADECFIELPNSAAYLMVRLSYVDGSSSAPLRYEVEPTL